MFFNLILRIKNKEGRVPAMLHATIKRILSANVPVISWMYRPLFYCRLFFLTSFVFFTQKFLNEPMFKLHCKKVGNKFRIDKGFPSLSLHLNLIIGDNVRIDGKNTFASTSVLSAPVLEIGDNTYIGYGTSVSVAEKVSIGRDCLIAGHVYICDNNGHPLAPNKRQQKVSCGEISPVVIGNNVWIGTGAFIGRGVSIGEGSVVGANAAVFKDIPAYSIAIGNPAAVIKRFSEEEILSLPPIEGGA